MPRTSTSPGLGGHHRIASSPCRRASSRISARAAGTAGAAGIEHTFVLSGAPLVLVKMSLESRAAPSAWHQPRPLTDRGTCLVFRQWRELGDDHALTILPDARSIRGGART